MKLFADLANNGTHIKEFVAVLSSIVAAILSLFTFIRVKGIESYKTELQKSLEGYKAELQKNSKENEVKFSKVYYDKATVIKDLYSKSSDVEDILHLVLTYDSEEKKYRLKSTVDDSDVLKIKEVVKDFISYFNKNRIFLSEVIEAMLCEIIIWIEGLISFIDKDKKDSSTKPTELDEESFCEFVSDFSKIRDELKDEFKKFLEISE